VAAEGVSAATAPAVKMQNRETKRRDFMASERR
jgi:hypothetical protein